MNATTSWMHGVLGNERDKGPESEEITALTNQFYSTLNAHLSEIEARCNPGSDGALDKARELAAKSAGERTWQDAYDLEQQLVLLFDDETLETELDRRVLEARSSLPPDIVSWYESAVQSAQISKKRSLLSRLVNDIQWRYTKDEARRGYTKQITKRSEIVFTMSAILFAFTVVTVIATAHATNHLLVLPFVGAAGAFGAAFSMMTSLKSRLGDSTFDDLKLNRSWGLILARILVGIGASYVLYFFITSGLLSGDAFPALDGGKSSGAGDAASGTNEATSSHLVDASFAKLFIWSFISGFSEKLVPNLLNRTQSSASESVHLPPQATAAAQGAAGEPVNGGAPESEAPENGADPSGHGPRSA